MVVSLPPYSDVIRNNKMYSVVSFLYVLLQKIILGLLTVTIRVTFIK